jgi:DNA-binding transcriptional regulator YiaG
MMNMKPKPRAKFSTARMRAAVSQLQNLFGDSLQQFADRTGVTSAAVLRWENGERSPSARSLWILWHLAQQKNAARLMRVFAESFDSMDAGYQLEEKAS